MVPHFLLNFKSEHVSWIFMKQFFSYPNWRHALSGTKSGSVQILWYYFIYYYCWLAIHQLRNLTPSVLYFSENNETQWFCSYIYLIVVMNKKIITIGYSFLQFEKNYCNLKLSRYCKLIGYCIDWHVSKYPWMRNICTLWRFISIHV